MVFRRIRGVVVIWFLGFGFGFVGLEMLVVVDSLVYRSLIFFCGGRCILISSGGRFVGFELEG